MYHSKYKGWKAKKAKKLEKTLYQNDSEINISIFQIWIDAPLHVSAWN